MAYTCHKNLCQTLVLLHFATLPQGLHVTGISKDKPARQCGLQFDDVIQLFAVATMKTVGGLHSCLETSGFFEKSLSDAATNGWSLILAIRRQPKTLI